MTASVKPLRSSRDRWSDALALCIGCVLTISVYGYQFGRSNHSVYLLDAIHKADPTLLANDWYTTQTFQYHALFGWMTAGLLKLGILQPAFLALYLGLVVLLQLAWMRLVQQLGGDRRTYLLAVLAYLLSAGGTGLGMYQFLQDGCVVPSNIANIALLWAVVFWIRDRRVLAGACVGIAGIFHLNHAIVGSLLWIILIVWDELRAHMRLNVAPDGHADAGYASQIEQATLDRYRAGRLRRLLLATLLAVVPSAINILIAAKLKLGLADALSFQEWLNLYVKFRHPHHYDPRSWPWALWLCYLWPVIPALLAWRTVMRDPSIAPLRRAWREMLKIALIFAAIVAFALVMAGYFYVSQTLVQMSLYRFSIYPQLLACTAAAWLIGHRLLTPGGQRRLMLLGSLTVTAIVVVIIQIAPRLTGVSVEGMRTFVTAKALANTKAGALALFCLLSFAPVVADLISLISHKIIRRAAQVGAMAVMIGAITLGWNRWIGLIMIIDKEDENYQTLAEYCRARTPVDAIFLVPPDESVFRVYARRAIVVNFKCVPQLNAELPEWRRRLEDVLGMTDLTKLPRGFDKIGPTMAGLYDRRMPAGLIAVAKKYGASYIITRKPLHHESLSQIPTPQDDYLLYELR